jgi:hypothetical protein
MRSAASMLLSRIAEPSLTGLLTASRTASQPSQADSNEYPNKPLKMLVGVAADGPTDSLAGSR